MATIKAGPYPGGVQRQGSSASTSGESYRSDATVRQSLDKQQPRAPPLSFKPEQWQRSVQESPELAYSKPATSAPRRTLDRVDTSSRSPFQRSALSNAPSRFRDESDLSPRARMGVTEDPFAKVMAENNRARFEVTPWEEEAGNSPSDTHPPPRSQPMRPGKSRSPGPSSFDNHGPSVSTKFGGYLHEPAEERSPRSPSFPALLGRHDTWNVDFAGTDRRPSVASTMTMSSTGSGRMGGRGTIHKKLGGFFGEEPPLRENRYGSDASTTSMSGRPGYSRTTSMKDGMSTNGQATPDHGARPKTPQPSSEVTPWDFQDPEDLQTFGEAPIKQEPTTFDRPGSIPRRPSATGTIASVKSVATIGKSHRLPLHRHRTKASGEDPGPSLSKAPSFARRQDSIAIGPKDMPVRRAVSPAGSHASTVKEDTKDTGKRSLFSKLRHRNKSERPISELPPASASSISLAQPGNNHNPGPLSIVPRGSVVPSIYSDISPNSARTLSTASSQRKESRLPFKNRRGFTNELNLGREPSNTFSSVDLTGAKDAIWEFDTNLNNMEGIVSGPTAPVMTPRSQGDNFAAFPFDATAPPPDASGAIGLWDAPDSWAVKKQADENIAGLPDLDTVADPAQDKDRGTSHCIRIFRPDGSFTTLSLGINTTAFEIVQNLARRTLLGEELTQYHILLKKHDTVRQLDPSERPLMIQKRLLEQAGYKEWDRLEELGREDVTHLCRFSFMPTKMSGFTSLDQDPVNVLGGRAKAITVDLAGYNLVTIPIVLYQKSSEVQQLNLSRNLSLDVPKDFIQQCNNLRDIKFVGNEAWRLPPSFSLAAKLQTLDVSNNQLEQLEHAQLERLENLLSLKLANNKLTGLPDSFVRMDMIRSLNISSNSLTEFPKCICDMVTLSDFDFSFNSITSLPDLGRLVHIERFWCTNNSLSGALNESFAKMVKVREFDMRFNNVNNIDVCGRMPGLEHLMAGHNAITAYEGSFVKIRTLYLDHNPLTRFSLEADTPTITALSLASGKLTSLPEELFGRMPYLQKLILDKNHFVTLSPTLGLLRGLEFLTIAKNSLVTLPAEIGRLKMLKYIDARENNIGVLPYELWFCRLLETLNLSSNVLDSFPKPPTNIPLELDPRVSIATPTTPGASAITPIFEDSDKLSDFGRRASQISLTSGMTSTSSSPGNTLRKGSVASLSQYTRKPSALSRASTDVNMSSVGSAATRKESTMQTAQNRFTSLCVGSLKFLFLADNRLSEDVFEPLAALTELRILNLSYNELYDIPPRAIRRWQFLSELYLSGNDLTSLPSEDLEEVSALRILHINNNKFQVLPAELGKVQQLAVLDVASNALKYNVTNWPYDWNWNWNKQLKYLNLSGNKRLEIKPAATSYSGGRGGDEVQNLTDFGTLSKLRILGLMDVTLMIPSVPDTTEDRRVRTSGSTIGTMAYGIADSLGRHEHLSTLDFVVPRLEGHDDESLVGMFDGVVPRKDRERNHNEQPFLAGHRIVKYLQENFEEQFKEEMKRKGNKETPEDALRRTYLALNRDLATLANQNREEKERRGPQATLRRSPAAQALVPDDLNGGAVATVLYLHGMDLYVSNVGDAQAVLIGSEGTHRWITQKHDPATTNERVRIREAGGYVSRMGMINDYLDISRAFGFTQLMPSMIAAPYTAKISLQESDEIILMASRELWDYLTPDFVVDLARSERGDLMRAAQKLRDLAIAFGAQGKVTVMLVGVSELRRRERARFRTHSMSMGPSGLSDDYTTSRRVKRGKDAVADSKLARLDHEVDAPVGDVTLVFTDIKSSTLLWQTYPVAMRAALRMHNELMRRQLRLIGGYEVKTEGDAFMVAFPTVTSALLWAFTIQVQLLEVPWPQEILNSVNGQEVTDAEGNVLFRGLSVRMGIHWGQPVCETDPVTRRMDYFGPMVNRSARIQSVADGGQITVSSDFISEVQRLLETHIESDRSGSAGSEESMNDDVISAAIQRELRSLSSHGFEVKDLGERKLKGLENPEYIYLMYPHSLSGRLALQQHVDPEAEKAKAEAEGTTRRDSQLTIDLQNVWDLWAVSLRLEMLCSSLENPDTAVLKAPETALLERTKERGGEVTDHFLINFVEHQVSRIETCITTLALRNMVRPFEDGMLNSACPMNDILKDVASALAELAQLKGQSSGRITELS